MTLLTSDEPFVVPPDRLDPLLEGEAGSQRLYAWIESVSDRLPLEGNGSPEGSLEANIGRLYVNKLGAQGSRIYMKATDNGENTGWELA